MFSDGKHHEDLVEVVVALPRFSKLPVESRVSIHLIRPASLHESTGMCFFATMASTYSRPFLESTGESTEGPFWSSWKTTVKTPVEFAKSQIRTSGDHQRRGRPLPSAFAKDEDPSRIAGAGERGGGSPGSGARHPADRGTVSSNNQSCVREASGYGIATQPRIA